ncbi:glycosyltransferase [Flavobacterium rivuli]|uniref:glycosyltransferase n=1 Tax=Flavobacterium rivuli TaxID=498301 RepID=UPI000379F927|nr:glycosyltransferase [Flavobacterium rivuli]
MVQAFKNSDIEILVATMNRQSLDFLVPMFPMQHFSEFNILVVNQTTQDAMITSHYPRVRVINVFEKGLSKSRNLALTNATGKLCVITDDDVVFKDDFCNHIINAFNENTTAALISFRVEKALGMLYKKYPEGRLTATKMGNRLNIMSIEMVVNRDLVQQHKIQFNENFGLGAQFCMGEEALFINRIYETGLQIIVEPRVIAMHLVQDTHARIVVWDKYYVQGALFTALFKKDYYKWVLFKIAYELKSKKIKLKDVVAAIKAAIAGRSAYNKLL